MRRLLCQKARLKRPILNASVVLFNTSMIVLDYDVCPSLTLGEVLRFAMGLHISVHNRRLYMSGVKSHLYVVAFKTQYGLALLLERIKQDGCLLHMFFFITFKPWLSIRAGAH